MKGERLARWIAGALAVLAVAATLDTVLSAPRHRERLARKEADLRRIEAYANRWAREDALRADLERRQAWTPANLDELAVRHAERDGSREIHVGHRETRGVRRRAAS